MASSFCYPTFCILIFDCVLSYLLCPAEIRYDLTLDALRAKARASFPLPDDKNDRRISKKVAITDKLCVEETFALSASTFLLMAQK